MKVAREVREVIDNSRQETLKDNSGNRKFMISIYYPADVGSGKEQITYYKDLYKPCEEKALDMLDEMGMDINFISNYEINILNNSKIINNNKKYPVIIFSPAFGVDRDMYMYSIKNLVKNGFVVVTVGATHESMFTNFPSGEFVKQDENMGKIFGTDYLSYKQLIEIRKNDLLCTLEYLTNLHSTDNIFKGKLDLDKVAIAGHSLGGVAAFDLAIKEEKIKACIMLDASFHLISVESLKDSYQKIDCPVLSLRQNASTYESMKEIWKEEIARDYSDSQKQIFNDLNGYKSFIKIHDAHHLSFSDIPLLLNKEDTNLAIVHRTTNKLMSVFLNEFLLEKEEEYKNFINSKDVVKEFSVINGDGKVIN